MLAGPYTSGVAAGSAGSATANTDTQNRLVGEVTGIYIRYDDSPPNTTDVVISTKGTYPAPPSTAILTLTNKNTDGWFFPRTPPHATDGQVLVALTVYEPYHIDDVVNISIAGANAGDSVTCWFIMEGNGH